MGIKTLPKNYSIWIRNTSRCWDDLSRHVVSEPYVKPRGTPKLSCHETQYIRQFTTTIKSNELHTAKTPSVFLTIETRGTPFILSPKWTTSNHIETILGCRTDKDCCRSSMHQLQERGSIGGLPR